MTREVYPDNGSVGFVGTGSSFVGFSLSFVAFVVFVGFVRTVPGHGVLRSSRAYRLMGWWTHGLTGSKGGPWPHGEDIEKATKTTKATKLQEKTTNLRHGPTKATNSNTLIWRA